VRGSHVSTAQDQWQFLPAILHALSIGGIVRHTVTVSRALGLEIEVRSLRRAAHIYQSAVRDEDVLNSSVGVENVGVYLTLDLKGRS
jgi:hypothetical protein